MGRVVEASFDHVLVENAGPLKPGDGVVFDAADWRSPSEPEEGGRVYSVTPRPGGRVAVAFANGGPVSGPF